MRLLPERLSIRQRLLLMPALLLASLFALQLVNGLVRTSVREGVVMTSIEGEMDSGHQARLKAVTDTAVTMIATCIAEGASEESVIARIQQLTDPVRLFPDQSGYFFAYKLDGTCVSLPPDPSKVGENRIDLTDHDGVRLVEELGRVAKEGGGIVRYRYEKPGKGLLPKMSYAALVPGSEIFLGIGVYVDDIQVQKQSLNEQMNAADAEYGLLLQGTFLALLSLSILGVWWVRRSIDSSIDEVTTRLVDASEVVTRASANVAQANTSLANSATDQAAALEETSAALEEISSVSSRNAEDAESARHLADETKDRAAASSKETSAMSQSMESIRMANTDLQQAMQGISTASENISAVTKVIDGIAFQTNLLALNAAVEAARAGEAGKGFAVVAEEVRGLAHRSADAAKETVDMIQASMEKSQAGEAAVEKVAKLVGEVTSNSERLGTGLDAIARSSSEVAHQMQQIATASNEQNQGVAQVTLAMTQIDRTTQGNAARAEEGAGAAENLSAQADELKASVELLQQLAGGAKAGATESPQQTA